MSRAFPETFSEVRIAPPIKRLMAMLYDFLILLALWIVTGLTAVTINGGEAVEGAWFQSLLFILTFSFFAYFWTKTGQTLGMQSWRLRVQTPEGDKLTLSQCLTRFFVAMLSIGFCFIGVLWMFTNKKHQSWHDMLSDTCVVELPKKK